MHSLALSHTFLGLNGQFIQPLVPHLFGFDHRILTLLVKQVGMNLQHFCRLINRRNVQPPDQRATGLPGAKEVDREKG